MKSPALFPARWDWPSAIGHLLLSFGTLEYRVLAYAKDNLSAEDFEKLKDKQFKDRLAKIALHFQAQKIPPETIAAFQQFVSDLEPIRELRNRIAHGYMVLQQDPAAGFKIRLFQVNDLDAEHHSDSRALHFDDLLKAINTLTDLNDKFGELTGWQTSTTWEFKLPSSPQSSPA